MDGAFNEPGADAALAEVVRLLALVPTPAECPSCKVNSMRPLRPAEVEPVLSGFIPDWRSFDPARVRRCRECGAMLIAHRKDSAGKYVPIDLAL